MLVDAFTAVGGSQFIDSPAIGAYGTYFSDEVVPFVDERFRTLPEAAHRGVAGKSSGGFGAMVWGMLRPDLFGAFATHAGDALFEVSLAARARRRPRRRSGTATTARSSAFWADFRSGRPVLANAHRPRRCSPPGPHAAAYSSNPDGSVDLPFRLDTGELVPGGLGALARLGSGAAGRRRTARRCAAARGIWIDAGRNDEYLLDLGAIAFRRGRRGRRRARRARALRALRRRPPRRSTGASRSASPFLAERLAGPKAGNSSDPCPGATAPAESVAFATNGARGSARQSAVALRHTAHPLNLPPAQVRADSLGHGSNVAYELESCDPSLPPDPVASDTSGGPGRIRGDRRGRRPGRGRDSALGRLADGGQRSRQQPFAAEPAPRPTCTTSTSWR